MPRSEVFSDERLVKGCAFCGAPADETNDHAPARVFLDLPYPEGVELPSVWACKPCNNRVALDEEYVACLVECAKSGTTDPALVSREKVRRALLHSPGLAKRLAAARAEVRGRVAYVVEAKRVRRVLVKFARAHTIWEVSEQRLDEPTDFDFFVLSELPSAVRERFESIPRSDLLPELGSRAFSRTVVVGACAFPLNDDWVEVQEGRYRYAVAHTLQGVVVRMVVSEYMGCEVRWNDPGAGEP